MSRRARRGCRADLELERVEDLAGSARAGSACPSSPATRASRRRIAGRLGPGAADVDRARDAAAAPHSSIISLRRDRLRLHRLLGLELLLEPAEASLRRPSVSDVRWMFGPFQVATSISTRVVSRETSDRAPPITPAIEVGPSSSSISTISASSVADLPVERLELLARRGPPDRERAPATRSRSNACSGWPVTQHHVVGDVDHVRDRPLAGRHQPRL